MRVALLSTAVAALAFPAILAAPTVTLGSSDVVGVSLPTLRQEFFAGIPYAHPPTGSLRLKPPVPMFSPQTPTFNATAYGLGCIQANKVTPSMISEDCLTINVLRSAGVPTNASLPVLVWIYGGGFANGLSSSYNGSAIVAEAAIRGTPVIYVNFNYRGGPLGFPQGSEAVRQGALNLGLKDQLVALEWVQANIGAFGGDKTKVTVFGQSAGAASIAIHMLQPSFARLARGAILESGSWSTSLTNYPQARESDWTNFVSAIPACAQTAHAGSFACLQQASLNSSQLFAAVATADADAPEQYPFVPVLDGPNGVYPVLGSLVLPTGRWSKIPFISGCNKDEGTAFIPFPNLVVGQVTTETWLQSNFSPSVIPFIGKSLLDHDIQRLLQLYPDDPSLGAPFGTGNETFGFNQDYKRMAALITDISFHSQRRLLQQIATRQGVPSYGYHFIDPQPTYPAYYGTTHSSEVTYVYGSCSTKPAASQLLCAEMIDYWLSFATSLTPNDGKGTPRPQWAPYNSTNPTVLQLNGTNTTVIADNYRQKQIAFLNQNALSFEHRR